jgi:isopenicillin-N N-acyltransferase-like protein
MRPILKVFLLTGSVRCTPSSFADATAEGRAFGSNLDMRDGNALWVYPRQTGFGFILPALTIIGCVGMIGMNEAGVAVGINNLVAEDGQVGVTWPFVIRKVLAQDNLQDALTCITSARLAGGHNYLLVDASGHGYNIEAMASRYHIQEVKTGALVHTNHCLISQNVAVERTRLPKSRASSETRLSRAEEKLGEVS